MPLGWALFIDDERNPEDVFWLSYRSDHDWTVCRSWKEVKHEIVSQGRMPTTISFDHDLGDGYESGHEITHNLIDMHLDGDYTFMGSTEIYVHSMNPVGREAIRSLWTNFSLRVLPVIVW